MPRGKKKEKLSSSNDKSGKLITISLADCPAEKPRKLNVNASTTVDDVVEVLLQSVTAADDCKYGVALASDTSIVFSAASSIAKIPEENFVFRKVSIPARVYIPHLDQMQTFVIDPSLSIADVILFIEHSGFQASEYGPLTRPPTGNATPNHELVLVTSESAIADIRNWCSSGNQGVHMEFKRSLGSYRVNPQDMMVLKSATAKNQVWKDMTKTEIPLIISSNEFHLTKAFKYPGTVTFDEVVQKFLEKANMTVSKWFYGLYLDVAGEEQYLEPHWSIGSFPLPVPARLTCKANPREKVPWFGTDPNRLPKAVDPDNGLEVPDVLLLLKDMLYIVNGVEAEGIFRRAGLESEMKSIKEQLQQGEKVSCKNPHTVGTMIKRWFKEVPVRLLEPLDKSGNPAHIARNLHICLGKEEYVLFRWLIDLLTRVAEQEHVNKMTPSNLAIVWGPGLVGSAGDTAFTPAGFGSVAQSGFDDTKFGIAIMEAAVTESLNKRRSGESATEGPSTGVSLTAATYSAPHCRQETNGVQTGSLTHNMPASELLAGIAEVKLRAPVDGKPARRRAASVSSGQGRIVRPSRPSPCGGPPGSGERSYSVAERGPLPQVPPQLPPLPSQRPSQGPPSPHRQLTPGQGSPRGPSNCNNVGPLSPRSQLSPRGALSPRGTSPRRTSPRRQQPQPIQQQQQQAYGAARAAAEVSGEIATSKALPSTSVPANRTSMLQGRPLPDASAFRGPGHQHKLTPPPLAPRQTAPPPLLPRQTPPAPAPIPLHLPGQRKPAPAPAALPLPVGPPPLVRRSPSGTTGPQQAGKTKSTSPRHVASPQKSGAGRGRGQNFDTIRVAYKTRSNQSRRSTPNLPPPSSFRKLAAEKEAAERIAAGRSGGLSVSAAPLPRPLAALPSPASYQEAASHTTATRSCDSLREVQMRHPPG